MPALYIQGHMKKALRPLLVNDQKGYSQKILKEKISSLGLILLGLLLFWQAELTINDNTVNSDSMNPLSSRYFIFQSLKDTYPFLF
jgi:hypothetical protein